MLILAYLDLDEPVADKLIAGRTTAEDHSAAQRYGSPPRRRQSLAVRALLRATLERETTVPGSVWRILHDTQGRPGLVLPDGGSAPSISLTHSGARVALALSGQGNVGVDVERHRARRSIPEIANFAFGPREKEAVRTGGVDAFYRIWTIREAIAKASGIGLLQLDRVDLTEPGEVGRVLSRMAMPRWEIGHWSIPGGYSLAMAIRVAGNEASCLATLTPEAIDLHSFTKSD